MAWTLHNVKALSDHMNNEESFIWVTSKISQSDFNLSTCDTKAIFLETWHDIDAQNSIYEDTIYNKRLYHVERREPSPSDPSKSHSQSGASHDLDEKSQSNFSNESIEDVHAEYPTSCVVKTYDISNKSAAEIRSIYELYLLMQHTNLLQCHGLYHDAARQQLLLSMEPLQMTLRDFVSDYRKSKGWDVSELQCKLIVSYLLYDLWTLHKTGFVHCDINPSNVMLRDRKCTPTLNGWRLIDYDNRLFVGEEASVKMKGVRGCLEWTPPESAHCKSWGKQRENVFTYGTDTWSLGLLILYVLFGGVQPYSLTADEIRKYGKGANGKKLQEYWYKKRLLQGGGYKADSTSNKGEVWLRNYLITLYTEKKISRDLFELLHDEVLVFDPKKRANAKTMWNHKWFDDYRQVCANMDDSR